VARFRDFTLRLRKKKKKKGAGRATKRAPRSPFSRDGRAHGRVAICCINYNHAACMNQHRDVRPLSRFHEENRPAPANRISPLVPFYSHSHPDSARSSAETKHRLDGSSTEETSKKSQDSRIGIRNEMIDSMNPLSLVLALICDRRRNPPSASSAISFADRANFRSARQVFRNVPGTHPSGKSVSGPAEITARRTTCRESSGLARARCEFVIDVEAISLDIREVRAARKINARYDFPLPAVIASVSACVYDQP